jgi:deazaflavin-dependent oxidoreductase (nitroreductase family)
MPLIGEYAPSPRETSRIHTEKIERSGGTEGMTMRGRGIVLVTTVGAKTGMLRKVPVMKVEHEGSYAMVASLGGAPKNPVWYYNLVANPLVELQDGTTKQDMIARELSGEERDLWWARSVEAFPDYADYQTHTERLIPVFLLETPPAS